MYIGSYVYLGFGNFRISFPTDICMISSGYRIYRLPFLCQKSTIKDVIVDFL